MCVEKPLGAPPGVTKNVLAAEEVELTRIGFEVEILALLIPIVAIIAAAVVAVVKIIIKHQERMAMIERGMHPDQLQDESEDGN